MKLFHLAGALAMLPCALLGAIQTEVVEYRQGDTVLEGWLAYDDAVAGRRPTILIVHQWKGLSDYEKKRAEMLARLGYTAFAVDIYGKGIRPQTTTEASELAGKYKGDRNLLRTRVKAGLEKVQSL